MVLWSAPIRLRYGQVYNHMQDLMKLPQDVIDRYASGDKSMAVIAYHVDVVRVGADGQEARVLLDDHYLHHFILALGAHEGLLKMEHAIKHNETWARKLTGCHAMMRKGVWDLFADVPKGRGRQMIPFGSAEGAEYRNTDWRMLAPFGRIIHKPQAWSPLVHIINTNRAGPSQPKEDQRLYECPCTPQRNINVTNGTIDGDLPHPRIECSPEFEATGNPSCHLETYQGGWRCCENGMFLIDTDKECALPGCADEPVDEVFLKATWTYEDVDSKTRDVEPAGCCDVTSDSQGFENLEYDIPQCPAGTPPEKCVHVAEAVQPIGRWGGIHPFGPSDLVDLVYAQPHLHLSGLSLELIDAVTNETLCEVHATEDNSGGIMYGTGSEPGNEKGFMVGLRTCQWGGNTARRFRRDHPMRSRAVYNATLGHTGVMSLWLMDVSAVAPDDILV